MRLYLDTSVYNRPFDDQTQPRIWLETLALAVILQMVTLHEVELVSSTALEYENSRNPFPVRRRWVARCSSMATHRQTADERVHQRAEQLAAIGLSALDAVHLACAEAAGSDYFVTCDDRFIRHCRGFALRVLDPVQFVREFTEDEE